jgi:hypothetical protein
MATIVIVALASVALTSTVTAGVLLRQLGARKRDLRMVLDALAFAADQLGDRGLIDDDRT